MGGQMHVTTSMWGSEDNFNLVKAFLTVTLPCIPFSIRMLLGLSCRLVKGYKILLAHQIICPLCPSFVFVFVLFWGLFYILVSMHSGS